jgi:uncharacterized protein (DUF1330 family)
MSAYFIFDNLTVNDQDRLAQYAKDVAPVVEKYGGRYLVVGGQSTTHEGDWNFTYPVIIAFEDGDAARTWYASDDYRPLKALRRSAVTCNAVLVEG